MDWNRSMVFCCFNIIIIIIIFFFLLMVPKTASSAYLGIVYFDCTHNTTAGTTLSSTFKHNLNSALLNLTTLSSTGKTYAITSAGSGDDIVYSMFQCRGDQTLQLCSDCIANATLRLPASDCPASIGARIQLDGCYLRYDNQSFFTPDFSFVTAFCNTMNTSDTVVLRTIESLVENVTTLAPEQGGFATARADGEYAIAQCLGYLNESECLQCLSTTSYRIYCDTKLGEQLHLTSCYYRYESYSFFETPFPPPGRPAASPPATAPDNNSIMPSSPPFQKESHQDSKTLIITLGVVAGAVILTVAICVILVWRHKASKIRGVKLVEREGSWERSLLQTKAKMFSLHELEEATKHFHPNNKLGEGGFGLVYKGVLSNGEVVAIKKLSCGSRQGNQEFLNEVNLITSVQHKNLIRLLGSCVEGPERILVYEYLPNEGLDSIIFGEPRNNKLLDWSTRFGIVLGMAKGLVYLHEESQIRIIHRDIKPSNILLDDQLNPVIADFGLARLIQEDDTHIITRAAGTLGYLAPEYAIHGELSEKVDVFSFGLVSLEIISGKRSLNSRLLEWVWGLYLQKKPLDLVDTKLGNAFSREQVIRIIHVALLCTQEKPKQRPTMSEVLVLLSGKSQILEIPKKPSFVNLSEVGALTKSTSSTSST